MKENNKYYQGIKESFVDTFNKNFGGESKTFEEIIKIKNAGRDNTSKTQKFTDALNIAVRSLQIKYVLSLLSKQKRVEIADLMTEIHKIVKE